MLRIKQSSDHFESNAPDNFPKLTKDIWVNLILPMLDIHQLLIFSTTSKEARRISIHELLNRPDFNKHIHDKIVEAKRLFLHHSKKIKKLRIKTWLGYESIAIHMRVTSLLMAIFTLMYLDELIRPSDESSNKIVYRISIIRIVASALTTIIFHACFKFCNSDVISRYKQHGTEKEKHQLCLHHLHNMIEIKQPDKPISYTMNSLFATPDIERDDSLSVASQINILKY